MSETDFNTLLEVARTDDNILGFILGGSRGKGFENENSDYDVRMIVKDEVAEEYEKKHQSSEGIDLCVDSYSYFKNYAAWDGSDAWDRYDFTHDKVLVDKTGDIASIAAEKGQVPEGVRKAFIERSLDGYINGVYRSVKCIKNDNKTGAIFEAANSIPYLLDALFAFNGRMKPFLGYLEKELKTYPLAKTPLGTQEFMMNLLKILRTGDIRSQQRLFKSVSDFFKREGFQSVFDAWEGKDGLILSFNSTDPAFHDLVRLSHIEIYGEMSVGGTSKEGEKFEVDFPLNNFHQQRFSNAEAGKYAEKNAQKISLNRQFEINVLNMVYSLEAGVKPKSKFNTLVYLSIPYTLYVPNYMAIELTKPLKCRVKFLKCWTDNSYNSDIFDAVAEKRLYYRPFNTLSPGFPIDSTEGWLPQFRGTNVEVRRDNTGYFRYTSLLVELDTEFGKTEFSNFDNYMLLKERVMGIVNYLLSVYRNTTNEVQVKSLNQITVTDVYSLAHDQGYYPVDSLLIADAVINEGKGKLNEFEQKLTDGFEVPIHEDLLDNAKCAFNFRDYKLAVVEAFQALDVFLEKFLFSKLTVKGLPLNEVEEKLDQYFQTKQRIGKLLEEVCGKTLDQIDGKLATKWRDAYHDIRNQTIHSDLMPTKEQARECIELNLAVIGLLQTV